MEMTDTALLPLRRFLEETLGMGEPIKDATVASIFDGRGSLHYAGHNGYMTASYNAITRSLWHNLHIIERGSVMHDVLLDADSRVEQFIGRELAKHGLLMADRRLPGPVVAQLRMFTEGIRQLKDQCADQNPETFTMRTSFSLREVLDGSKNWDVVLRAMIIEPNERVYIEYTLPKLVQGYQRLLHEEQVECVIQAASGFLETFAGETTAFAGFCSMEPTETIAHYLAHDPTLSAEKIYDAYRDQVAVNKPLYREAWHQRQAELVKPWTELTDLQRKLWLGAVEAARLYIQMYLQVNKQLALR
jgi:hypothetical protein